MLPVWRAARPRGSDTGLDNQGTDVHLAPPCSAHLRCEAVGHKRVRASSPCRRGPIHSATREICAAFGRDPLRLIDEDGQVTVVETVTRDELYRFIETVEGMPFPAGRR
jgi:hypothetical protein